MTQTEIQSKGKAIKKETSGERIASSPPRTSSPSRINGDVSAAPAVPHGQGGSHADRDNKVDGDLRSPITTLFVGGIARWVKSSDLERKFREFGHVRRVDVPLQFGSTKMSRGYAFVHFLDAQDAEAAIEALDGSTSDIGTTILVEKSTQGRRSSPHRCPPSAPDHRGYAFEPLTSMNGGDPWGRSHSYHGRYDDRNYDRDGGRSRRVCLSPFESEPVFDRFGRPVVHASYDLVSRLGLFDRYGRHIEYLPRSESPRRRVMEEYVQEPRLSRGYSPAVVSRFPRRQDSPPFGRRTRSPPFSSRCDRRDRDWDGDFRLLRR